MPGLSERKIYDAQGGIIRTVQTISDTEFVIGSHVDVEPIIDEAKALRETSNFGRKGEIFRHAAKVPPHVVEKAFREGWFHDDKEWAKWMNDPANRDFRVWEGQI